MVALPGMLVGARLLACCVTGVWLDVGTIGHVFCVGQVGVACWGGWDTGVAWVGRVRGGDGGAETGGYAIHMGHVQVNAEISNADGTRSREVEAMVDTGATYTFLPGSMLRELGIAPTRTTDFQLANGEMAQYARGEAVIRINGFAQMTPVVFGDDYAEPLIGVVTLEQLELAVDPVADALIPARPRL